MFKIVGRFERRNALAILVPLSAVLFASAAYARPGAPSNVVAQSFAPGSLSLVWKNNANESGVVFDLEGRSDPSIANWAPAGGVGMGSVVTYTFSNLAAGEHCFRVWSRLGSQGLRSAGPSDFACASVSSQPNQTLSKTPVEVVRLSPDQRYIMVKSRTTDDDGTDVKYSGGPTADTVANPTGAAVSAKTNVEVGFNYSNVMKSVLFSDPIISNSMFRSGIHFSLLALAGASIVHAELQLITHENLNTDAPQKACASEIGPAREPFWTGGHWHDRLEQVKMPAADWKDVQRVDVTRWVQVWVASGQAASNSGLIISGPSEDENANTMRACTERFADDGVKLEVTYRRNMTYTMNPSAPRTMGK